MEKQEIIPIFFATDDNYVPCLCVALKSITANCNKNFNYKVHILNTGLATGLSAENMEIIKSFETDYLKIEFNDVSKIIAPIKELLNKSLRDYYSDTTFYRIFIPKMFPEYHKVLYLDCDIVVLGDIAELYHTDLKDNCLGAVTDEVVPTHPVLIRYVEEAVGIPNKEYFCAGIILFNLDAMRQQKVDEKFIGLLSKYSFTTVGQDQDYLNVICKGRVTYLHPGWDKQANNRKYKDKLYLIHYNMFSKPWRYKKVPYEKYFWKYAKKTPFYRQMLNSRKNYTQAQRDDDAARGAGMIELSLSILNQDNTFKKVLANKTIDEAIAKTTSTKTTKSTTTKAKSSTAKSTKSKTTKTTKTKKA